MASVHDGTEVPATLEPKIVVLVARSEDFLVPAMLDTGSLRAET